MTDPNPDDGQKTAPAKGVLLQAKGLAISSHEGVNLLSDISFHIEPGELVALSGLSRTGKSILLQSLAGLRKPASGEILLDGINLYTNLKAFRPIIGFVASTFAFPQGLTVRETLQEAARLRLPRRTSARAGEQRVLTVLEMVGLTDMADYRLNALSRLEKRRLGIAVELVSFPGILLIDEAAEWSEQLTPFEEVQITILLRELSRQGLTIIQMDHRARRAGLSDKVIFLAPGGLMAWFGPPNEAFLYLRDLVPRGVAKDLFGLREAVEILANPQKEEGIEWAKRFKAHEAYQKYVDDPLHNRYPDLLLQTRPLLRLRLRNNSQEKLPPSIIPRASTIQKFMLLIRRNVRILWRDKTLFAMLAIPVLVAIVDFFLSSARTLSPDLVQSSLGLLVFISLLLAGLLVQNEIFKERAVYQRESRTASLPFPYILSKVWLVGSLAVYQGLIWAVIHFIATGMAGGPQVLLLYGITFFLITLIGGILGLIASAFSKTAMTTTSWLLLFTVPQIIFIGSMIPGGEPGFPFNFLSVINPARYAVEILMAASRFGQGLIVNPLNHWFALVIMSLALIILLLGIQQRVGRQRI